MKIVLGHMNADLDALASMVAATLLFPGAVMVNGRQVSPPVRRFLALHKDRYRLTDVDTIDAAEVTDVVVVDTCDRRRLRDFESCLEQDPELVIFDHHPATDFDLDSSSKTVEPVGACITLLVEELLDAGIDFCADDATLFMLGLYSDTGRLSYATTTARDLTVARHLLERGANLRVVNRFLRDVFSPEQTELLGSLLQTTEEHSIRAVEIAVGHATTKKNVLGASAVVQQVMEFGGHDVILGFIKTKKRVQVIGRSRVSYIHIGELFKPFGGGGHAGAGAVSFKGVEIEEAIATLLDAVEQTDFVPTRVSDLMSSPLITIESDASLTDAVKFFEHHGFHGAPVTKQGKVVGVISKRDIARARRGDHLDLPVASHMTVQLKTIDLFEPIEDALDEMTVHDVGRLLVTEHDEPVGIITRSDLIRRLYMLPEDETDFDQG